MGIVDRRIAGWVELVHDLITHPTSSFPRRLLEQQLFETFDCWVSWNWMDRGLGFGFTVHRPIPGWPTAEGFDQMQAAANQHPLLRWYAASGDNRPMSTGRVPREMVSAVAQAVNHDHLTPVGIDQQLSIPYRLGPGHYRTFLLGRTGADFPGEDVETARQLQPLLRLVDRHFRALQGAPKIDNHGGLTGREIAVVQLLADGLTATSIAGRLAISPRTVHRHLENAYRKLGASGRVRAVLAAEEAGLLTAASADNRARSEAPDDQTGTSAVALPGPVRYPPSSLATPTDLHDPHPGTLLAPADT